MMELYEEKVELNRQRLWEEEAQLEIGRLKLQINVLQEKLSRALENNKKLRDEREELCQVRKVVLSDIQDKLILFPIMISFRQESRL
jgi:hypothetical protein